MDKALDKTILYAFPAYTAILVIFWFQQYYQIAISSDVSYLTLAAERMLQGLKMSEAYYDTTPPLSFILYAPAVHLSQFTGIPIYMGLQIYFTALFLIATYLSIQTLRVFPSLYAQEKTIIICTFAVISTIFTTYSFGQKDHILGMFLFPFTITQLLMTYKTRLSPVIKWTTLILGSFFILLKPHFGIVPVCTLIHRMIVQRRYNVYKDHDFFALALSTTTYAIILIIFFSDFLYEILPNIINLYAHAVSYYIRQLTLIQIIISITPLLIGLLVLKNINSAINIFSLVAALCLIPVFIQGKGFFYHYIPHYIFFYCCLSLLIWHIILQSKRISLPLKTLGTLSFIALLTWLTIIKIDVLKQIPKHNQFIESELAQTVQDCEKQNCKFFMFNDMINMQNELDLYTSSIHTTRFPYYWFLPALLLEEKLLETGQSRMSRKEINDKYSYFMPLLLQDLEVHEPDILIIGHIFYTYSDKPVNFKKLSVEKLEDFNEIWERYELEKSIIIDRGDYMVGKLPNEKLIKYDIYKRKEGEL